MSELRIELTGYGEVVIAESLLQGVIKASSEVVSGSMEWDIPSQRPFTREEIMNLIDRAATHVVDGTNTTVEDIFSFTYPHFIFLGIRSLIEAAPYDDKTILAENVQLLNTIEEEEGFHLATFFKLIIVFANTSSELLAQAQHALKVDTNRPAENFGDLAVRVLLSMMNEAEQSPKLGTPAHYQPHLLPALLREAGMPVEGDVNDLAIVENPPEKIPHTVALGAVGLLLGDESYKLLKQTIREVGQGLEPTHLRVEEDTLAESIIDDTLGG